MIEVILKGSISRGLIMGGLVFGFALVLSPSVGFGHAKLVRSPKS